ncbi:tRNA pseudouridine(55) synthase TruB [Corynebacterium aquilae]|uniref:tRNA pseudouridine synthase B n=1 Tax=Corynebacterium aquilae DSM 44791 TaxID=1431546 RepID=A0A1L7CGF7_9CORY|nr:tRNA pseudouridine(55) synthase TruB [Corynebacterium aquilae]APT84951.1 pseudouridine synthase [Corynebacterium aquilae DSM 44791]
MSFTPVGSDPLSSSGLVVVDKPAGMTSHDVVARVRRAFSTRKVGHAGTLDPMATGVLVVGVERGTRFLAHVVAEEKTYETVIRLGASTVTDDAEGARLSVTDAAFVSDDMIAAEVAKLTGRIMQRPSSVSAIKINGRRAHELVRAGENVEIPAREVTVFDFDVLDISRSSVPVNEIACPPDAENVEDGANADEIIGVVDVTARVRCSSGTYIRSLARDMGEALGVGGHLIALRRTAVGPFSLDHAVTVAQLAEDPRLSLPLDDALTTCFPTLKVSADEGAALAMGKWLEPRGLKGVHAAVTPDGHAVALVKESGKRLKTTFVARPSTL